MRATTSLPVNEFEKLAVRLGEAWTTGRQDGHVLADSGFEGLEAVAASVVTPYKRRLHWRHRRINRLLAGWRIPVEPTLASVRRLRILRDDFRNWRRGMVDEVIAIRCTLHNFRCECRQ